MNMIKVFEHNKSLLPRTTGLCALKVGYHPEFGFEGPNLRHRKGKSVCKSEHNRFSYSTDERKVKYTTYGTI